MYRFVSALSRKVASVRHRYFRIARAPTSVVNRRTHMYIYYYLGHGIAV